MKAKDFLYISPITDFGFEKCFRDEIVMKGFLTALFEYAGIKLNIINLTYLNNESDGERKSQTTSSNIGKYSCHISEKGR